MGGFSAYARSDNSVDQWLPQNYETTDSYERFQRLFGSDEAILVSWVGCSLDDPRLEQLACQLEGKGNSPADFPFSHLIENVTTGQREFRYLRTRPLSIQKKYALRRLEGTLIGPDQNTTCAVVTLSSTDSEQRVEVVEAIRDLAIKHCGISEEDLRLTGDVVLGVGIDIEGQNAINEWVWVSAALAFAIAWLCLRSIKMAIIVFLVSQYCQALCEAAVFYSGGSMNLLVGMSPVLVYVLSLSACVHLANYYRDATQRRGLPAAPLEAVKMGWRPCLIAAVTTSLGLLSLCVSHVRPVKEFGVYSSVGVLLGFGALIALLPAILSRFPVRDRDHADPSRRENSRREDSRRRADSLLTALAGGIVRYRTPIVAVFGVATLVLVGGLLRLKTAVEPVRFLPDDSRWISDANWYKKNVGPLASVEMVVGFHEDVPLDIADRLRLVYELQSAVGKLERVGGTLSAASFSPVLGAIPNSAMGVREKVRRHMANRLLEEHREGLVQQHFLADDGSWERWRVSARVAGFRDLDYTEFLLKLRMAAQPVLDKAGVPSDKLQLTYTGAVPLVFAAQRELLDALMLSFFMAVILVAVVLAIVLKSPAAGMAAMLPNVFPAVATFGIMGWAGSVIDVGAMMTASIGLGIAVDDTLHMLTWFRHAIRDGKDSSAAILFSFQRCAPCDDSHDVDRRFGIVRFLFQRLSTRLAIRTSDVRALGGCPGR